MLIIIRLISNYWKKTVYIVFLFNRIVRRCIETIDAPALEIYERKNNGKKENRKLWYY